MPYTDKTLTCVDCGSDFVFSVADQEFHAEKGFMNEPRRCRSCRASRRAQRGSVTGNSMSSGSGQRRELFSATCASCGKEARVPFEPRGDKPVYCSDCFQGSRSSYDGSTRGAARY